MEASIQQLQQQFDDLVSALAATYQAAGIDSTSRQPDPAHAVFAARQALLDTCSGLLAQLAHLQRLLEAQAQLSSQRPQHHSGGSSSSPLPAAAAAAAEDGMEIDQAQHQQPEAAAASVVQQHQRFLQQLAATC